MPPKKSVEKLKKQSTTKKITQPQNIVSSESQHPANSDILLRDIHIETTCRVPCDLDQDAFIPYWTKENGEKVYGIDVYSVKSICGCGDVWICRVENKDGAKISQLEPNVDVFFSEKEAERKLSSIKKMEDDKKLAKWKRKVGDKDA